MRLVSSRGIKRLLFRAIPSLLVLAMFEAGLQLVGLPDFDICWYVRPDHPWQEQPDPELGWLYRPGDVVGRATLNERGWRGPILPDTKAPGHFRILYIGDSTCFGQGVALELSFAAASARGIQQDRPDVVVEYQIGALPGYSSHHSRVLTRRLLPLEPDLVVFYVGGRNDHSSRRYFADGDIPARIARRQARWHQVRTLLLLENIVDRSYKSFFGKLRTKIARTRVPPEDFRRNVDEMVRRTLEAGAVPLLLSPPFSADMRERHPMVPRYQEAIASVAAERGAHMIDLHPLFTRHADEDVYFRDLFHFSRKGHAIAAEEIRAAAARIP